MNYRESACPKDCGLFCINGPSRTEAAFLMTERNPMAEELAVTDSAPVAETAPSEVAVEQAGVTHGDTTEQAAPTDDTAEVTSPEDEGDEDEESDEHLNEEEKTKAQKRRERREKREQERIDRTVTERLEQAERAREVKATQEATAAKAKAADEAWQKRFGDLVGTPEVHQTLQQEIAALTRQAAAIRPYETDDPDAAVKQLEPIQKAILEKAEALDKFAANSKLYKEIDSYQLQMTLHHFEAAARSLPPDHARLYLAAQTIPEIMARHEAGIVAREAAKHEADKATAVKAVTTLLEKERADHAATRTGGPGAGPVPATGGSGSGGSSHGVLTPERYAAMEPTDRARLRSTPEGRAQIDDMTRRAARSA